MPEPAPSPARNMSFLGGRRRALVVVSATMLALSAGVSVSATATASTAVAAANVRCGDNIHTYQSPPPGSQTLQRLTYINCTGRTLHRKADIAWGGDGDCKRIGPWETVVLAKNVLKRFPIHIRGSKAC